PDALRHDRMEAMAVPPEQTQPPIAALVPSHGSRSSRGPGSLEIVACDVLLATRNRRGELGASLSEPMSPIRCMTLRDVLVQYYNVLFVTRCEPVGADFKREF